MSPVHLTNNLTADPPKKNHIESPIFYFHSKKEILKLYPGPDGKINRKLDRRHATKVSDIRIKIALSHRFILVFDLKRINEEKKNLDISGQKS